MPDVSTRRFTLAIVVATLTLAVPAWAATFHGGPGPDS
jgi:hypothetical protein